MTLHNKLRKRKKESKKVYKKKKHETLNQEVSTSDFSSTNKFFMLKDEKSLTSFKLKLLPQNSKERKTITNAWTRHITSHLDCDRSQLVDIFIVYDKIRDLFLNNSNFATDKEKRSRVWRSWACREVFEVGYLMWKLCRRYLGWR